MNKINKSVDDFAEKTYKLVDEALRKNRISFERKGLRYDIPNFSICFKEIIEVASKALKETKFYAQEMPYREMMPEFKPDYLLVLCADENK